MINAIKARELAIANQWRRIENAINKSTLIGILTCTIDQTCYEENLIKLKQLSYKITDHPCGTIISW